MKEKTPATIFVKVGRMWQVIRWSLASEEQKLAWLSAEDTTHGNDKSTKDVDKGHGKNQRKRSRGGRRSH